MFQVPNGVAANLDFRQQLLEACAARPELRAGMLEQCRGDFLFWLSAFGWTYDPRQKQPVLPFVPYDFQVAYFRELQEVLGVEDLVTVKSRTMGVSWMILALFLHRCLFRELQSFAVISRNENYVDKPGDPKTLFWKLDFMLERLPDWMRPRFKRTSMHLLIEDTGSVIDGDSTTGNALRGDRRTAVLMDEFGAFDREEGYKVLASSQAATFCRLFVSTPQGSVGAFYDQAHSPTRRRDLHWSVHPVYARGLYYENEKAKSPWYLGECRRMPVQALIGQELDCDFAGSSSLFFRRQLIDRLIEEDGREPYLKGRLEFEPGALRADEGEPCGPILFVEDGGGPLHLWMHLKDGEVQRGEEYSIGCDISAGTGATNSVLSVASKRTGAKVGEVATPHLSPDKFADLAVAVARFFNDAFLIWEMAGPGGTFGKRVIQLGYRNIYWRQNEMSLSRKSTDTPGWFPSDQNKRDLFLDYAAALEDGRFLNRSVPALRECLLYVYLPNGKVANQRAAAIADGSGARENHGDRPTADALANKGLRDVALPEADEESEIPVGSLAWRRKLVEKEEKAPWSARSWRRRQVQKVW